MAAGLPDLVDCARLAADAAALQRVYEMDELPRLKEFLAKSEGALHANFAFANLASGRPGAEVSIEACPQLVCQRCLQGFGLPVSGGSQIEFAAADDANETDAGREYYRMNNGHVSLRELAEEELLLALPFAPACATPLTCGKAPSYVTGEDAPEAAGDMRRPFSVLQDLLKKT